MANINIEINGDGTQDIRLDGTFDALGMIQSVISLQNIFVIKLGITTDQFKELVKFVEESSSNVLYEQDKREDNANV